MNEPSLTYQGDAYQDRPKIARCNYGGEFIVCYLGLNEALAV